MKRRSDKIQKKWIPGHTPLYAPAGSLAALPLGDEWCFAARLFQVEDIFSKDGHTVVKLETSE